jgi:hypothetical protein
MYPVTFFHMGKLAPTVVRMYALTRAGNGFGVVPEVVLSAPSGHLSYVFAEAVPDGVSGH